MASTLARVLAFIVTNAWLSIICQSINSNLYTADNCTFLQVEVDGGSGANSDLYLRSYVPYVCMSYGKSSSAQFECQADGLIKYTEYDDADCSSPITPVLSNLDTGSQIQIDSQSSTIQQYNCNSTEVNATCEFLDIRVYTSCESLDSQFYDEVYIVDKCVPSEDGKYQITECWWQNATTFTYSDADCTQNEQVKESIYDDDIQQCTDTCRDVSNCRRNFTLCSVHPWSEFLNRCQWDVAAEFFCRNAAGSTNRVVLALVVWFVLSWWI